MPLHFSSGGLQHSCWLLGWGEMVTGQIFPARWLAGVNGSPSRTFPVRSASVAWPQTTVQYLPRPLDSTIFSNAATWHTVQEPVCLTSPDFLFSKTSFNDKGPTNPHIRQIPTFECKTWKSDILKNPLCHPGMKGAEGRLLTWLISAVPASAHQGRMGWGQAAGTAEAAWARNENSKADSCAFLHRAPWEN